MNTLSKASFAIGWLQCEVNFTVIQLVSIAFQTKVNILQTKTQHTSNNNLAYFKHKLTILHTKIQHTSKKNSAYFKEKYECCKKISLLQTKVKMAACACQRYLIAGSCIVCYCTSHVVWLTTVEMSTIPG